MSTTFDRNQQSATDAANCSVKTKNEERLPSWRSKLGSAVYRCVGRLPWPVPEDWSPTFLIGCGRSGTTITGQICARHPSICLLNEPRHIWRAALPATDIWYQHSSDVNPRMVLGASDIKDRDRICCRRMFYVRQRLAGRPLLMEKLPINNFRLELLAHIFPGCRFVHLIRHGLEVAQSIARTGPRWYGANGNQKWHMLRQQALDEGWSDEELESDDAVHRGLVEWTLSVGAVQRMRHTLPPDRFYEVRYAELLENPRDEITRLMAFLRVTQNELVAQWAARELRRRNPAGDTLCLPIGVSLRTVELLVELGFQTN